MTADWPTEAREAVAEIIRDATQTLDRIYDTADAVLAALAPHVQPRTDDWEWGVRWMDDRTDLRDEPIARGLFKDYPNYVEAVIRRRPAGEWEVAP